MFASQKNSQDKVEMKLYAFIKKKKDVFAVLRGVCNCQWEIGEAQARKHEAQVDLA